SEIILPSESIAVNLENPVNFTESNDLPSIISENEQLSDSSNNSNFEIGLIIGISVGIAIGISLFFIIRQKNT
ncbi:MAG: hypothetical protein ACPGN7_05345, partial [Nitrosopumilus sp.]